MTQETITRSGGPKRLAGRACLAIVTLSCSGAALIAGCTSSSTSGSGKSPKSAATPAASHARPDSASPSASGMSKPNAAACVHIISLRTSLTSLTHVKVSANSAAQLSTDLANIQTQLTALKGQHLGSFSTEANQLMADINKIKKDAAELSSNPAKAAKALSVDITTLKTRAGPMVTQMKMMCHTT